MPAAATNGSSTEANSCSASQAPTSRPTHERATRWRSAWPRPAVSRHGTSPKPATGAAVAVAGGRLRLAGWCPSAFRSSAADRTPDIGGAGGQRGRARPAQISDLHAPAGASGRSRPAAASTATSTICSAVFSLETSSGRISHGHARAADSTITPPTITRSRNTTRMASQSGSTCHRGQRDIHRHQQRLVGHRVEQRAHRVASAVAAGQPAVERVGQAGGEEQEERRDQLLQHEPDRHRHHAEPGEVMTFGSVSSVAVGRCAASDPSGIEAAFPAAAFLVAAFRRATLRRVLSGRSVSRRQP